MSQKGSAARRRPSMDWPLSREEKKCCAMKLYERDVQTANELLERKDETVKALKEEVKELRRASLGSTTRLSTDSTATGTRSSLSGQDSSFSESPVDLSPGKAGRVSSPSRAAPVLLPAESPPPRDVPAPRLSKAGMKPSPQKQPSPQGRSGRSPSRPERTMQRASSLEVFGSAPSWWESAWKKPAEAEAANVALRRKSDAKPPRSSQEGGNAGSPRRTLQRSQSLEKTSSEASVWKGVWKGVRNVARGVKESATETARILADEARTVADDVRQLGRELAETGLGNQDAATGVPSVKSKSFAPAEYMEWFLHFAEDSSKPGLELERHADGDRWCVKAVETGLAVAVWNADAVPVTIYLQPGRREKVVRRMAVRRGDEIFAVDGETPQPDLDLEADEDSVQRLRKCQALTFRRKIPLAAPRASTEGSA